MIVATHPAEPCCARCAEFGPKTGPREWTAFCDPLAQLAAAPEVEVPVVCPLCGHEGTISVIERVTRRTPLALTHELDTATTVVVTRIPGDAHVLSDHRLPADLAIGEAARHVGYECDPGWRGCGARFDSLAALRVVRTDQPAQSEAA